MLRRASRLLGTVLDTQEKALEGVRISVLPSMRYAGRSNHNTNLRSDEGGRFVAEDLSPGSAELRVSASGFASHNEVVDIIEGEDTELEIHLVPGAVIIGHLTDETGNAVTGAAIRTVDNDGKMDTTDATGGFFLFGLLPGSLELEVHSGSIRQRFKTVVTSGEQNLLLELDDDPEAFVLRGRVVLSDNSPVAGVTLRIHETMNGKSRYTVSGPDGAFQFEDLAPNDYAFDFSESDLVPSAESVRIALRSDVEEWILEAQIPCSLTGRVVGLTPRELGELVVRLANSPASKVASIDHITGEFTAADLLPGKWVVNVNAVERPLTAVSNVLCEGRGEALTAVLDFNQASAVDVQP